MLKREEDVVHVVKLFTEIYWLRWKKRVSNPFWWWRGFHVEDYKIRMNWNEIERVLVPSFVSSYIFINAISFDVMCGYIYIWILLFVCMHFEVEIEIWSIDIRARICRKWRDACYCGSSGKNRFSRRFPLVVREIYLWLMHATEAIACICKFEKEISRACCELAQICVPGFVIEPLNRCGLYAI